MNDTLENFRRVRLNSNPYLNQPFLNAPAAFVMASEAREFMRSKTATVAREHTEAAMRMIYDLPDFTLPMLSFAHMHYSIYHLHGFYFNVNGLMRKLLTKRKDKQLTKGNEELKLRIFADFARTKFVQQEEVPPWPDPKSAGTPTGRAQPASPRMQSISRLPAIRKHTATIQHRLYEDDLDQLIFETLKGKAK